MITCIPFLDADVIGTFRTTLSVCIFPLLHQLHHLLQPQLGPYSFETHLDSYSVKHAYSIP